MEIASNSGSDEENVSQQKMPLYTREVAIEGIDESQKRGGSNGVFKKQKLRLWAEGHSYRGGIGVLFFRCSRYKPDSPCNGRGFTVKGMFHVTAECSHENKRNGGLGFEVQKRSRKGDRLACQLSTTPIETLVKKVRHGASQLVRAHLPSKDSMARRLRQKKLKEVLRSINLDDIDAPPNEKFPEDEDLNMNNQI